jgi:hypothetical protein
MVFALALVAGFAGLSLSLSTGTASAEARPIPNCMGKDMGTWARDGSIAGVTGPATFESGSGWGGFVSQMAQNPNTNWGQLMVVHLAGGFYGSPGITCAP